MKAQDEETRKRAREQMRELYRKSGHNFSAADIEKLCNDATEEINHWAAFALSELSAAEEAERERCCKDVCEWCAGKSQIHEAKPVLDAGHWRHLSANRVNTVYCKASLIRNR